MPRTRIAALAIVASCLLSTTLFAQSRHKIVDFQAAAPLGAWRADVWEDVMESSSVTDTTNGYHMATTTKAFYGNASFNTVIKGLVDLDHVTITYNERTDNAPVVEVAVPLAYAPEETDRRCVYGPTGAVMMKVCRKPEENLTTVSITRQSQDVTYDAEESGKANVETHEVVGPQTRLGATSTMSVVLAAGNRTWSAQSSMV
ncbi:MAG TPA: hypothetical protein VJ032_15250, partial [Thermoanaerobaculia bacterium]|nr:hypothetical protein [Thermoanaerobaculia bacterium]